MTNFYLFLWSGRDSDLSPSVCLILFCRLAKSSRSVGPDQIQIDIRSTSYEVFICVLGQCLVRGIMIQRHCVRSLIFILLHFLSSDDRVASRSRRISHLAWELFSTLGLHFLKFSQSRPVQSSENIDQHWHRLRKFTRANRHSHNWKF